MTKHILYHDPQEVAHIWEFPGGPVVKTPWHTSPARALGSFPGRGTKILQAACWGEKKKKKERKVAYNLLSHLPCLENLSPSFMEAAQIGGFASTAWLSLIPFLVVHSPVKSLCVVSICSAFLPLDIKLPKKGQFCPHLRSHTMLVTSPQWKEAELIKFSESESESHTVMSDSLRPHWLYSPWNFPGQNTGVGSLSLLQETFPTQGLNPGVPHCRRILYQLSHKGRPKFPEGHANSLGSSSERIN